MADGVVLKRVQTFGRNVDITREQATELANSGVVEYVADSPSVTIQIDTNEVGSNDTLALLTDGLLTQSSSYSLDSPLGGTNLKYYVKSSKSNFTTITEQEMLNGYCGITATFNEDGTQAKRTMWVNHAAVTGVNLSYDVNGNATENYTLAADNCTWFLNEWANARCAKMLAENLSVSTTGDNMNFINLTSVIPDGSSVLAIGVNNTILRSTANNESGTTGNLSVDGALLLEESLKQAHLLY
jgi:hypothetical protein